MKWPWVSRSTYEADLERERTDANDRIQWFKDVLADERTERRALSEKYHALRLQGQTVAPSRPDIQPPAFDPIEDAISERAGQNAQLRRHLSRIADRMRGQGKDSQAIIDAVTKWRDPDEEVA